ncbi:MAG: hypothetical protein ACT4PE_00310 [Candidatus Eiseniibacteriota bacterium]
MRLPPFPLLTVLLLTAAPGGARAEEYRLRVDARFQSVGFRGVSLDSIPAADAVVGESGGLETPDGIAVRCPPGSAHCFFFRPGERLRVAPVVTTTDLTYWGFGVPGLSLRASSRFAGEAGDANEWPGTDPAVQLLVGYLEYADSRVGARAGRLQEPTRFGLVGYDGGRGEVRARAGRIRAGLYGGWGLARASALPPTSSSLDPLDDFRPRERQHLFGTDVRVSVAGTETVVLYQREVDPRADDLVSERVGAESRWTAPLGLVASAGADYDVAAGYWGSGETRLAWSGSGLIDAAEVGARRYRPHFDLWTIWGMFSPVPYRAISGDIGLRPRSELRIGLRGETWDFENTGAHAPLVRSEDDGWRWSALAEWTPEPPWRARAGLHQEFGPGASSLGYQAGVDYALAHGSVGLEASYLRRPLEFRFDESRVWTWGAAVERDLLRSLRLSADLRLVSESRERPDAAAFDWNQTRVSLAATWAFGSATGRPVPPAVLRIPSRPRL